MYLILKGPLLLIAASMSSSFGLLGGDPTWFLLYAGHFFDGWEYIFWTFGLQLYVGMDISAGFEWLELDYFCFGIGSEVGNEGDDEKY